MVNESFNDFVDEYLNETSIEHSLVEKLFEPIVSNVKLMITHKGMT